MGMPTVYIGQGCISIGKQREIKCYALLYSKTKHYILLQCKNAFYQTPFSDQVNCLRDQIK